MESLTSHKSRWLRKTTAAGMIPLLLAQASIALFCSFSHEGNQRGKGQLPSQLPSYRAGHTAGPLFSAG